MKRTAICFITVIAICLSLCPTWAVAAGNDDVSHLTKFLLPKDQTGANTFIVDEPLLFDTCGHTYTVEVASAVRVEPDGEMHLTHGKIESKKDAGIEVMPGGSLISTYPDMTVTGATYGLKISSGANVQLSGGTYTGKTAAVFTADDDTDGSNYAALLAPGCAFFDEAGNALLPSAVAEEKTVEVRTCTEHVYDFEADGFTFDAGSRITHTRTCLACNEKDSEPCTFDFDENGSATCDKEGCGHTISITINGYSFDYDGNSKAGDVDVTVMLDDSIKLNGDTHYTVECLPSPPVDVGEITVTVSGKAYIGDFTTTCSIIQNKPQITWADTDPRTVNYTGSPVDKTELPDVIIEPSHAESLRGSLYYSYRESGDEAAFTDGLPTDAGTYEIVANLPGTHNYEAASSDSITLTINKIDPVTTHPVAVKLVYNGTAQELVTSGAVRDGAVIQFASSKDGSWSTDIPTGTNAQKYVVWYKVEETNNYFGIDATEISDVEIKRKGITPDIELEYYTCVYDGGDKEPKVTVRDPADYSNPLPNTEYEVTYDHNQAVGTADVTVTDKEGGNYAVEKTIVHFEITPQDQASLTITNKPNTVSYGDVFTLETSGGSGEGTVKWEISGGTDIAEIGQYSGQVTVKDLGDVTVKATKSDGESGNHKDATATWTFTAGPKHVVATVTATNKVYDGDAIAEVDAEVEKSDLVVDSDIVTIDGLTGAFSDANAGTYKAVTVNTTGATFDGTEKDKYAVTIPSTPVRADITKASIEKISTAGDSPIENSRTYDGTEKDLLSRKLSAHTTHPIEEKRVTVPVEYARSENGPYYSDIPKATNAGNYEVWYRVADSDNYFGTQPARVDVVISKIKVTDPVVTLTPSSYTYDGKAKEPAVTVTYGGGSEVIPSNEYDVAYSDNVNVGTATVTVTAKVDGNYEFDLIKENFTISKGNSAVLTSSPQAKDLTYNGKSQELVTVGTATGGHLEYSFTQNSGYSTAIPTGTDADEYTVYYKVVGDNNFQDSSVFTVYVTIKPKTVVSPAIELEYTKTPYTGTERKPTVISVTDDEGETIDSDQYEPDYRDNVNAGTATVIVRNVNKGNYFINASTTFEIKKAKAEFTTDPTKKSGLVYKGFPQQLVTAGVASAPVNGTVVYALDGGPYSPEIPTATACGTYTVQAKVQGDANHEDSDVVEISDVEIGVNNVTNPVVSLSANSFRYDGNEHRPAVTLKDDGGDLISPSEYDVTYSDDLINVGTATVTITAKANGNYTFTSQTENFTILAADQTPLTITGKPGAVYYGDTLQLSTTGGSGNGAVSWSVSVAPENSNLIEHKDPGGQFKITGVGGPIEITATKAAGGNYTETTDTWVFYADPKPVNAVVTVADKVYDGDTVTNLSVTVPDTKLSISNVTAAFRDANVGTNKLVTINHTTPTVTGDNVNYYAITYPDTATASITPATLQVEGPVTGASPTYSGSPQELLSTTDRGTVKGVTEVAETGIGYMAYSTDGVNYGAVPTRTDAGTYTVWYKAVSTSGNYKDSEPKYVTATIGRKSITPTVTCSPDTFPYDGTQKTPNIIVEDGGVLIPASEYDVKFDQQTRTAVGSYTVTVSARQDGNYTFTTTATGTFEIVMSAPLSIVTDKPTTVYYGDSFDLTTVGGAGTGTVEWSSNASVADVGSGTGRVTVKGVGPFTVTAKKGTDEASITFIANRRTVTPVIRAEDRPYNGDTDAELIVTWNPGDMVKIGDVADNITITLSGAFDTPDVGINKHVSLTTTPTETSADGTSTNLDNYHITYPTSITGSIYQADAKINTHPKVQTNILVYNRTEQDLLSTVGAMAEHFGDMEYSLDETGPYSKNAPTAKDAGTYKVWYRVEDSVNWKGIGPNLSGTVTIAPQPVSTVSVEYNNGAGVTVKFDGTNADPADYIIEYSVNWESEEQFTVTVRPRPDGNYSFTPVTVTLNKNEASGSTANRVSSSRRSNSTVKTESATASAGGVSTSVKDGTASTVLTASASDQLVSEAVANQSTNVVIRPEITSDVTRTEVSIPASAVSRIQNQTSAAITVSTPVAGVTIPNASLSTLSAAGSDVSVVTEQVENTVVLTLTAGGNYVGTLPGGLTLTVPAENAGPGTVAVLVYEDGTRETVRKSVAENGEVRIPLDGSATVEIVDNSRDFADVPSENWASDAVAFASAHELFNGTGETTFSPELSMSRAMLATVLYNLEGHPVQSPSGQFSDVSSDAWYAAGVAWATENGITGGYGGARFGPEDSVTREQFAVMLWRYAGAPEAAEPGLTFTDAGRISSYARQALRWAAANGIMSGYGNGLLDPGGVSTRAQAAQMLKNFIENF